LSLLVIGTQNSKLKTQNSKLKTNKVPVEIKELVIRMVARETASNGPTPSGRSNGASQAEDRDALVAACVKQVLTILEKKKKR
jgi:ribose 5-phosphate isomerase